MENTIPHTAAYFLKKHYGYDSFRPLQEQIINCILSGRDTLVLMPTGGGKSLCFQIPALMLSGITLVVSPLISLMKDQVDALRANGIEAAYLNSSLSYGEEAEVIKDCISGSTKLLYIAPERLVNAFDTLVSMLDVRLIAIDEAHCISSWGHDFRPEYTQLQMIKEKMPHIPIVALTATADKVTRKDIITQLNLQNPEVFLASFNRQNLSLSVKTGMREKEKLEEIIYFIRERSTESGIIYCMSRKITEKVAEVLNVNGIPAKYYHAGMSANDRSQVQEEFSKDETPIICATIAFGMGIDKSNVRWIMHYNLPKNIEGYYQEIGRAGRDGLPSDTILYYSLADIQLLTKFAVESGQAELNVEKLQRIQQFAEADVCRRRMLLSYFGESYAENCGNCDVCQNPPKHFDGTVVVQKALSAIKRLDEKVGFNMLIDVLRGSHRQEIINLGYDKIKTYGAGSDISATNWKQYLLQMLNLGFIEMAYDEAFALKVSDLGKEVLFGKRTAELILIRNKDFTVSKEKTKDKYKEKEKAIPKAVSPEEHFTDELRKMRRTLASLENVPPYMIFNDAVLEEMVKKQPLNEAQFLEISGFTQFKFDRYGQELLAIVRKHTRKINPAAVSTQAESFRLFQQGLSPEQIAEKRNLGVSTIFSHLAAAYQDGADIDLTQFVSNEECQKVEKAVAALEGDVSKLKPIFEFLKEEIPYHKIRIALTLMEH